MNKKEKKKVRKQTALAVKGLIESLESKGLKPQDIAEKLNTSKRSIYRWRDEGVVPFKFHILALEKLLGEVVPA